jgi:hypothetical protein
MLAPDKDKGRTPVPDDKEQSSYWKAKKKAPDERGLEGSEG